MTTVSVPAGYPTLDELQSRVLAVVAAALPAESGWRPSVYAPRQLGLDGGPGAGQVYSVELPRTELPETRRVRRDSQYGDQPLQAHTTVIVRWLWTLPADGQDSAYADALKVEAKLVGALVAGFMDTTSIHPLRLTRTQRDIIGDGTYVHGMIEGVFDHAYVIQVED